MSATRRQARSSCIPSDHGIGKIIFFHFLTCARGAPRGIVVEFTAVSPEKALGQTLGQKGICQPRPGECRARDAVFCGLMRCPAAARGKPGMVDMEEASSSNLL